MKRLCVLAAVGFLLIVSPALSEEKSPLTFNDFIRIKRIADPQVSPNGTLVAYVVTEMDLEQNSSNSDIYVIPLKGGEAHRLTTSPKSDSHPRWSPDGKTLAFISSRGGTPQVWLLNLSGGEARQLTHVAAGAAGVEWSPNGTHLAFLSSLFPDAPDAESNAKLLKQQAENPVKAQIFNELLFRHWNSWRDGQRSHLFVIPVAGGEAVDVSPGDFDTPPISLGSAQDYAFSPDGTEIAFVRNIDPELRKGLGTNNDVFTNSLDGKNLKQITDNRANDNGIAYSPDGRFLAYRAMARPGFEADRYQLMLFDRKLGTTRSLTPDADFSVGDIFWDPKGIQIFFTYQDRAWNGLAVTGWEPGSVVNLRKSNMKERMIGEPRPTPDGRAVVFMDQSINSPPEVFVLDLDSLSVTQLTHTNDALLETLEMLPLEDFVFQGAQDKNVHGLLVKPPAFDPSRKYPLVMLIHGGPQGAWMDNFHFRWNAQMFASPGYVVAMINFHGSTGYGQEFTDSISGDWGGKPYIDLEKGLDFLLENYAFIDADRLSAAGASYGGYMINWIEGHSSRYRCLISHAGVFDLRSMHGATEELWFPEWEFQGTPWTSPEQYTKWSPSAFVQDFKTPCLVIHGQLDFRVPVTQGFQLFTALQRQDVPSKLLYFPDEGHFIARPR
ncbi:MAG: prolyl oligopeptidase family serine peptidase, partial [Candidatus Aminicenantaceae bacterium]